LTFSSLFPFYPSSSVIALLFISLYCIWLNTALHASILTWQIMHVMSGPSKPNLTRAHSLLVFCL